MIKKYSRRSPKIIYLMGIDGSGKSTLSKVLLKHLLEKETKAYTIWFGFKEFHILYFVKIMKLILGSQRTSKVFNLHALSYQRTQAEIKLISRITYLMYSIIVMVDYLVWYVITLRKYKNYVIIADRYIFDMFVTISTVCSSEEILYIFYNLLKKFVVKPIIVIYIDVPPSEALKRKPEKSLKILEFQKRIYNILINLMYKDGCKIVIVNGLKPLHEVMIDVLHILISFDKCDA